MIAALAALLVAATPPLDVDARIRASDQAAQALQGPLDGAWSLYDAAGARLYAFQLVDPVGGHGPLQGAWRDLRGREALGVFSELRREGDALILRLPSHGESPADSIRLRGDGHGAWRGRISGDPASRAVVLKRDVESAP